MPNRVTREGFLDSQAVNNLTESAECFYHRLLLAADDAGRYDGRTDVIRSKLYPVANRKKAITDIEDHIRECVGQRLIFVYDYRGKPFLQVTKWHRCGNSMHSRFPDSHGQFRITFVQVDTRDGKKEFVASSMECLETPIETPSPPHADGKASDTPTNTKTETNTKTALSAPLAPVPDSAEAVYSYYPKKVGKPAALRAIRKALRDEPFDDLVKKTIMFAGLWVDADMQFCPHPATWFNQQRYNDDPKTWEPKRENAHQNNKQNPRNDGIPDDAGRSQRIAEAFKRRSAA